jgi:hypothetical protein
MLDARGVDLVGDGFGDMVLPAIAGRSVAENAQAMG